MSVKDRLKKYISSQGLAISMFEKSINVSNGYVNSIAKGIGGDKLILIIEKYPNINIEWLLVGKGEMLKGGEAKTENTENYRELAEARGQLVGLLAKDNARLEQDLKELKKASEPENSYGRAAEPDS